MNRQRWILITALLAIVVAATLIVLRGRTWTFSFDRVRIEAELAKRFPLRKTYLALLEVDYTNPRVTLTDGSEDIAVGVDVRVGVTGSSRELKGSADLLTKIAYDADSTSFLLREVRIVRFAVPGIGDDMAARVRDIANDLATDRIGGIPVYRLKSTDVKHAMARLVLRSVVVRDAVLHVTIGV
jgi:Protein of unknown function (DUF1439)